MTLLELEGVSFEQGGKTILSDITFQVEQQDFILVTGASGSGKSTLLKLCGHLISPTGGDIRYQGKDYTSYNPIELRQSIAYSFQSPYLFGSTVMDNITFPFTIRNVRFDRERAETLFSMFQMSAGYLDRDIRTLSGGEKQRIALIRSLIFLPRVLLLDEVTSALDQENAEIVERVLLSLHQEGVTLLWITHNPEQSKSLANKMIKIEAGRLRSLEVIR